MRALWSLGFRPFYLLGASYAALSVALWGLQWAGVGVGGGRSVAWHGQEMLFGFTIAIVAGFLFTAVRNWTQRPTPTGAALAALAALWIAGRVLAWTPFALAAGIVNALFPLAVAVGIGIPLVQAGNRRNYFFLAVLAAVSLATLRMHLDPAASLRAGLDLVLFVIAVMAGRVVPMFTNNGVPGAGATRDARVEKAALGSLVALLVADLVGAPAVVVGGIAMVAALAHGARLALWKPWRTGGNALVWILHASYGWIVLHLALRVGAAAGFVPTSLADHALTVGGIGGMVLGMITRTALGHTGRPLHAGRTEIACFVLLQAAAVARVALAPLLPASTYGFAILAAATCWSAAFALYVARYWPILTRPRADGAPG